MSPFLNRNDDERDETGPQGQGLHVDVDEKVCVSCRRSVPAWLETCPDCGGEVVAHDELPSPQDALLRRFLDQDVPDAPSDPNGTDAPPDV